MFNHESIQQGMVVRSIDGEKLGKVSATTADTFHIEKGIFFPKDYSVRYGEVSDVRNGEVILLTGKDALREVGTSSSNSFYDVDHLRAGGSAQTSTPVPVSTQPSTTDDLRTPIHSRDTDAGYLSPSPVDTDRRADLDPDLRATGSIPESPRLDDSDDIRVPVVEEELEVHKRQSQSGALRIKKDVIEEVKTVSVPVLTERVTVERSAVGEGEPVSAGARPFERDEVVIPVYSEELEARKRAVVKDEVRIRKDRQTSEQRVAESVRKEDVRVETEGDVDDTGARQVPRLVPDPKTRY